MKNVHDRISYVLNGIVKRIYVNLFCHKKKTNREKKCTHKL